MSDERDGNGSDQGDGGGGGRGELGSEDETQVDRKRTPTELEILRADGEAFDRACGALDALAAALPELPALCERVAADRASGFCKALILRLGELVDFIHETRHDLTELKRHYDAQPRKGMNK